MINRAPLVAAALTALAIPLSLTAAPANTAPTEPSASTQKMTAAQKDTIKKGGMVVSDKRLDATAAAAPCSADEFHNSPDSENWIRITTESKVWKTVYQGYYAYGHLNKLEVVSGMDTYIFDWNYAGQPVNGVTLRPTGWHTLSRWGACGVRTVGDTWPQ